MNTNETENEEKIAINYSLARYFKNVQEMSDFPPVASRFSSRLPMIPFLRDSYELTIRSDRVPVCYFAS